MNMLKSTMTIPPSPPPPAPTSASVPRISRKTLIAAGILVIIVVAVVVGVLLATRGGGGGSTGGNVAGASSLQFSEDITSGGNLSTYKYWAKDIGTSNVAIRIEWTSSAGDYIYIVNGALRQAWVSVNGQWTDLSSYFSVYWNQWNSTFSGINANLISHWSGSGDYTYSDSNGDSVRIYGIAVNPSLSDSLFVHS